MKPLSQKIPWMVVLLFSPAAALAAEPGFTPLFDGKTLDGWTVNHLPKDKQLAAKAWTVDGGTLLADTTAPRVTESDPLAGAELTTSPGWLRAGVDEWGSGFEPEDADILLNGRMLLAAWDIDEKVLSAEIDESVGPGEHRWEVNIVDRVGNRSHRVFDFRVAGR